jgi:predicted ATPase
MIVLSSEHGFPQWLAFGRVFEAWLEAQREHGETRITRLREAIDTYRAAENELYVPYFSWLLAMEQLQHGESAIALDTVASALTNTAPADFLLWKPEFLRLEGDVLLARDPGAAPEAEALYRQAIDAARTNNTKSWELRAVASLARLLYARGERTEARQTLGDVFAWFTEGFETADLKDAKALLEELST